MFFVRRQALILLGTMFLGCSTPGWAQQAGVQDPETAAASYDVPAALAAAVPEGRVAVKYEDGDLTIQAHTVPLIDVLRAVCVQIGAELDAPLEANETVVAVVGPGPAREVLTSLLNGSPYELGTAGSAEDPNALVRVVVFAKSKTKNSAGQESKNSDRLNGTAEPVTQPQIASTSTGEKASTQEMLGLLGEAKSNFVDNEVEEGDPSTGVVKAQMGDIFKALEALIKTGAAAEANGTSPSPIVPPAGSLGDPRRHRTR
jgi:hypothetical protein